jgi:Family of unknown function (DUF6644)
VLDAAKWLQGSALGHFMRESGVWTYAIVNLAHILGVASLFGSVLVLDLRLLGVGRHIPLASIADATVPVATVGFSVAAATGAGLLVTKATEYVGNPFLALKFPAIALALVNVLAIRRSGAWRARGLRELTPPEHRRLAVMGGLSLACWLVAIAAGRLIAYW